MSDTTLTAPGAGTAWEPTDLGRAAVGRPRLCAWCDSAIAPGQAVIELAGMPLHAGGPGAPDCRRELDTFLYGDAEPQP
jgi:hypothetical protein